MNWYDFTLGALSWFCVSTIVGLLADISGCYKTYRRKRDNRFKSNFEVFKMAVSDVRLFY